MSLPPTFFIHSTMASACVGMSPETTFLDFEFPLHPPATMLPADQLFSDGKLKTLTTTTSSHSYRWKHLLRLNKHSSSSSSSSQSLVSLIHRKTTSSSLSSSDNAPLLTSSLHSPKSNPNPIYIQRNSNPRTRIVNPPSDQLSRRVRLESDTVARRGVSVDSPRMNSSGKVVFHSLERSASTPTTFNAGPRFKHRGIERTYSANVEVTPVLNVPLSSLRAASKSSSIFGFAQLFSSPHKKGERKKRTRTTKL